MIYISRGPSNRDGDCRNRRESKTSPMCGSRWKKGSEVAFKPVNGEPIPFCLECAGYLVENNWAKWAKKNDESEDPPNSPLLKADEIIQQLRARVEKLEAESKTQRKMLFELHERLEELESKEEEDDEDGEEEE